MRTAASFRLASTVAFAFAASLAQAGTVTGTALYRERMALPPGATFEAMLEDVSRAGAPATILGRYGPVPAGTPPFAFKIEYADAAVVPGGRYNVRTSVRSGDKLLFITDRHVEALTGKPLDLRMVRVAEAPTAKGGKPPTSLRNTHWKLVALNGKPVTVAKGQREPHLVLKADELRVSGSGGCNNVMGGFELEGESLRFIQMASTMMACPEGMEQEGRFLKTLESVARFRIAGDALTLFDAKGRAAAKFRAVALR